MSFRFLFDVSFIRVFIFIFEAKSCSLSNLNSGTKWLAWYQLPGLLSKLPSLSSQNHCWRFRIHICAYIRWTGWNVALKERTCIYATVRKSRKYWSSQSGCKGHHMKHAAPLSVFTPTDRLPLNCCNMIHFLIPRFKSKVNKDLTLTNQKLVKETIQDLISKQDGTKSDYIIYITSEWQRNKLNLLTTTTHLIQT